MTTSSLHYTFCFFEFAYFRYLIYQCTQLGLPRGPSGKESTCQCRSCGRCSFHPWARKIPWRRTWQPRSSILSRIILWTEELGDLQSMGSQRIRYKWLSMHTLVESSNISPFVSVLFHQCCSVYQNFILFLNGWIIFHCVCMCVFVCTSYFVCVFVCTPYFVYLFICWWTFWLFAFLVFVNNVAMNIGIQVCVSLLLVLLCEIGGLYGNSV